MRDRGLDILYVAEKRGYQRALMTTLVFPKLRIIS